MHFLASATVFLFSSFFQPSTQSCVSTCASSSRCNVSRGCPDGWQGFQRLYGRWCMKVFYGSGTQSWALGKCRALNATLSGIQDYTEQQFIGKTLSNLSDSYDGGVWVGARRRPQCYNSVEATDCTPETQYAFYWIDGSTHGFDGFTWHPYRPRTDVCVAMYATNRTAEQYYVDDFYNGQLVDLPCSSPTNSLMDVTGYVCGKIPSLY